MANIMQTFPSDAMWKLVHLTRKRREMEKMSITKLFSIIHIMYKLIDRLESWRSGYVDQLPYLHTANKKQRTHQWDK